MRVPLEWLREYVDIYLSVKEAAHALTMAGLEVEAIEEVDGDHVLEINVTPNRPDCLSIFGIARELSAITGMRLKSPDSTFDEAGGPEVPVEIADRELCRRYAGRVIKGVKVAESPAWLTKRLEKCGQRPINNIVDITNYVLLELGHPLHAFDLATLRGKAVRVAVAGTQRSIVTLDGTERKLEGDALLIWDGERPVAVAGVMGGAETEVKEATREIFLESAHFRPESIRRTSKMLGLKTESSYRFERGADIEALEAALDRASFLISRTAGGSVYEKVDAYPGKIHPTAIPVGYDKVNRVLGTRIDREEMTDILKRLQMAVKADSDYFEVTPPSFRGDIRTDADVIEEVARLYGYGRIPTSLPEAGIYQPGRGESPALKSIKEALRKSGFHEAINYSFMNEKYLDLLGIPEGDARRRAVAVRNPLRTEDSLLRTTLVPSLAENFTYNFSRGMKDIRIFEMAKVFIDCGAALPLEASRTGGVYYREKSPALWKETTEDFYVVKGAVESVFDRLKISDYAFGKTSEPFLHPGKSSDIFIGDRRAGFLGVVSPDVLERLEIKSRPALLIFELETEALVSSASAAISYKPLPRFPAIERDIAIVLDESVAAREVLDMIRRYPSEHIEEAAVFDSYRGANMPEGKRSLAFSVRYRAKERTLTDEEVDAQHRLLLEHISHKTGGEIRGV